MLQFTSVSIWFICFPILFHHFIRLYLFHYQNFKPVLEIVLKMYYIASEHPSISIYVYICVYVLYMHFKSTSFLFAPEYFFFFFFLIFFRVFLLMEDSLYKQPDIVGNCFLPSYCWDVFILKFI